MKDINFFRTENSLYLKSISSKSEISLNDNCDGYFLKTSESEARRIIDSLKGKNKIIALQGLDNNINRRAVETLRIDYLVSPEFGKKKDTLKQRDSGLNHVVAKEAKRKKISIVINLSYLSGLNKKEKSLAVSRIIQNIKICRRAKCKIKIASFARSNKEVLDEKQRISICLSLGMNSIQTKECCDFNLV